MKVHISPTTEKEVSYLKQQWLRVNYLNTQQSAIESSATKTDKLEPKIHELITRAVAVITRQPVCNRYLADVQAKHLLFLSPAIRCHTG